MVFQVTDKSNILIPAGNSTEKSRAGDMSPLLNYTIDNVTLIAQH